MGNRNSSGDFDEDNSVSVDDIVNAIDIDKNGVISALELKSFVADEEFMGNHRFPDAFKQLLDGRSHSAKELRAYISNWVAEARRKHEAVRARKHASFAYYGGAPPPEFIGLDALAMSISRRFQVCARVGCGLRRARVCLLLSPAH